MINLDIDPKKILFIQQRQLGDVLLASHALMQLKKRFPNAQIDFLTEKKCAQVIENNPNITDVYYINKKEQPTLLKQIAFYKKIAKNKYDLVISLQNLPRCLFQTFFSKAPYRLGLENVYDIGRFDTPKNVKSQRSINFKNFLYSKLVYTHMAKPKSHFSGAKKLDILEFFGIKPYEEAEPLWYFKDEELIEAKKLLLSLNCTKDDILFTMDVTTNKNSRRYPKEYYAKIITSIQQNIPNAKFLFLRAESEEAELQEYLELLSDKSSIILPEKCPSIRLSAALMAQAKYHIGNCSFPRHLAVALDVPSTILIGAGESIWDYPDEKYNLFHALVAQAPKDQEYLQKTKFIWLSPDKEMPKILEHIKKYI